MAKKYSDLSGKVINNLYVIKEIDNGKRGTHYECLCDCGEKTEATSSQLFFGKKMSCGCIKSGPKLNSDRRLVLLTRLFKSKLKNSGRGFEESLQDLNLFEYIITSDCFYCGAHPNIIEKDFSKTGEKLSDFIIMHHGIDRLDSNVDYHLTNIVSCCKECNYGKETMSFNEFILHSKAISNYLLPMQ